MDVRCKLLGHVRDSTEFEERQEDRPGGTVLICREYQVCRRCGDREEMYRNEQVLSPESSDAVPGPTGSSTDPEARDDAEESARAGDEGTESAASTPAKSPEPEGGTPERAATAATATTGNDDEPPTEAADRNPAEAEASSADTAHAEARETDDTGQVTDDGVILSGSSTEPDPAAGSRQKQPVADGMGPASEYQETDDSPTSLFDVENDSRGRIRCGNCDEEWERSATSLRDGDICPDCRSAYVEEART